MRQEIVAARLIPSGDVGFWGKQLNNDVIKPSLIASAIPYATFRGYTVYYCHQRCVGVYDEYFITQTTAKGETVIVFYSCVKPNQQRNKLLKPSIGRMQSLVWKALTWESGRDFAPWFILKVLLAEQDQNYMVITDMKQTAYGAGMWGRTLLLALKNGYKCYYGLSAPSDAQCLIKVEDAATVNDHYGTDIVSDDYAYAYRCALITKPTVNPQSLLLDPERTLILTNEEAEELGAYESPKFLTTDHLDDKHREYDLEH